MYKMRLSSIGIEKSDVVGELFDEKNWNEKVKEYPTLKEM